MLYELKALEKALKAPEFPTAQRTEIKVEHEIATVIQSFFWLLPSKANFTRHASHIAFNIP